MILRQLKKFWKLICAFFAFSSIKKWGVISETYERTKFDHAFTISYSQAAEDLALIHILSSVPGFYIDVGAHHPSRFSVTRLLYQQGWRGINIDANPDVETLFEKDRPRDQFIFAAVGQMNSYEFTRFQEPAISTANSEWRRRFENEGNLIRDEIKVPGLKLFNLLCQLPKDQKIDFLNIDIEGSDFDAFKSLELPNLPLDKVPKYVALEATWPVSRALETDSVKLAMEWGYKPALILPMATVLFWPQ